MDKQHLSKQEILTALKMLDGWDYDEAKNCLTFSHKFKSFSACFAMMTQIALIAEKQNHHPDWFNSYRTLSIELTSHDCGGITARDTKMAASICKLFDG